MHIQLDLLIPLSLIYHTDIHVHKYTVCKQEFYAALSGITKTKAT